MATTVNIPPLPPGFVIGDLPVQEGRVAPPEGFVIDQPQQRELTMEEAFAQEPPATADPSDLRRLGLGVRGAIEGITTPITIVPDIAGAGIEAVTGRRPLANLSEMVSETLTNLGVPEPETAAERVATDILGGVAGGGALARAGQRAIAGTAGALGGGAAGMAREAGAPIPVQIGAGLAGGVG